MIEEIKKVSYSRVELSIATLMFGILLVFLVGDLFSPVLEDRPEGYVYYSLIPRFAEWFAISTSFYLLNFYVFPTLWLKDKKMNAFLVTILIVIFNVGICSTTKFYIDRWLSFHYGNSFISFQGALKYGSLVAMVNLSSYCIYVLIREVVIRQIRRVSAGDIRRGMIFRQIVIAVVVYLSVILLVLFSGGTIYFQKFGSYFFLLLPICIVIYFVSLYWLIPAYQKYNRLNTFSYILALLAVILFFGVIELLLVGTYSDYPLLESSALEISAICFSGAIAVSWWVYYSYETSDHILSQYKSAQAQSIADLESLRSQINPHFLFNTLNTLCGIAITEKADRTYSGIQKLGEMMRFMLHENNLSFISLTSEIHYLKNYVDLQGLRISHTENVEITVNIQPYEGELQIAPMLMIPLIENSYKHGISYSKKSFIKISLSVQNEILELEVRNSLHPHSKSALQEQSSGIGLDNVKQRLRLLYGDSYGLLISSDDEFRVKLTLNLS